MKKLVITLAGLLVLCVLLALQPWNWPTTSTLPTNATGYKPVSNAIPSESSAPQPVATAVQPAEKKSSAKKTFTQTKSTSLPLVQTTLQPEATVLPETILPAVEKALMLKAGQSIQDFLSVRNAPTRVFYIKSNDFTAIHGLQGVTMQFVPSTFRLNDSTFYEGTVRVEMKEIVKQDQMVFGNFSTTSNGELIESAGMIYWNATTADGQPLQMDSAASVLTTFSGNRKYEDYQLFTGQNNGGGLNWTLYPAGYVNNNVATFPVAKMPFRAFKIRTKYYFLPEDIASVWNDRVEKMCAGDYAGTAICSYEFLERLEVIRNMGWDNNLLDFYLDNPGNLNKADSLAVLQLFTYSKDIKESNFDISKAKLCAGTGKRRWVKMQTARFRSFFLESRGFSQTLAVSGKDSRTVKKLTRRVADSNYAAWLLNRPDYSYNFSRCDLYSKDDQYSLRRTVTPVVQSRNYQSITLRVPRMGYINCDRFLNEPDKRNILVKVNNLKETGNVYSFLIFKKYNAVMNGELLNTEDLTFRNLPANNSVCIIVVGNKENKTFFAYKDIYIKDDVLADLTLTEMPLAKIESTIRQLTN